MIPGSDNAATLAWLEESLMHARDGGPTDIVVLLEAVLIEVLFEIDLSERFSLEGEREP